MIILFYFFLLTIRLKAIEISVLRFRYQYVRGMRMYAWNIYVYITRAISCMQYADMQSTKPHMYVMKCIESMRRVQHKLGN